MGFDAQSADGEGDRTVACAIDHEKPAPREGALRMSVTSGMPRSSVIWQSGSTLIAPPDRASRRLFETRSSKKSGTRLIASIKESRPPAARRRDQLRRPDRAIRRSARPSTTRTLRGLRSFLEHHAFSRQVVPFRLLRLELVCPLPQRRSGVQVTFFDPGRPSDFPELRGAVRPHAFGWPTLFPVRYLWSLLRWQGQCMGAVGPRKRPHCLMCFGYGGD